MFAIDNQHIALMVNMTSVFSSAFTILFLFWSSSIILKKLTKKTKENINIRNLRELICRSLAYTFSDSFWFNAVEAEVYAMASY
jgi:hypothetical protein